MAIAETLGRARHPVPSVAALIAHARRGSGTVEVTGSDAARPHRLARHGAGHCGARIEAVRRALDRPVQEAASALRTLVLREAQPAVAGIASP